MSIDYFDIVLVINKDKDDIFQQEVLLGGIGEPAFRMEKDSQVLYVWKEIPHGTGHMPGIHAFTLVYINELDPNDFYAVVNSKYDTPIYTYGKLWMNEFGVKAITEIGCSYNLGLN